MPQETCTHKKAGKSAGTWVSKRGPGAPKATPHSQSPELGRPRQSAVPQIGSILRRRRCLHPLRVRAAASCQAPCHVAACQAPCHVAASGPVRLRLLRVQLLPLLLSRAPRRGTLMGSDGL
eukprot:192819-Chlamydomonas_euryale.AAC.8